MNFPHKRRGGDLILFSTRFITYKCVDVCVCVCVFIFSRYILLFESNLDHI